MCGYYLPSGIVQNCFLIDWHFPDDVVSASLSISIASGALVLRTCRLAHLSVCRSVQKVYCGKTADWIRLPFGMVSGVGQGMGVLDGGGDRIKGKGQFWE